MRLFDGGTFSTSNPDLPACKKMAELQKGAPLKCVAFTPSGGWVVFYGRNGYYGQGHVATCLSYDAATAKAFHTFRDAYRGHGPEGIPLSADQPGLGPPQ